MYSRPHHQRIQQVLQSLDAARLLKHQCLFGGGTAIVLAHGEYRESVDIDFIVSSVDGYRGLRGLVNAGGIHALMTRPLPLRREVRIDQYGIRCALDIDGMPIKLEIVFEGRVALADPLPEQRIDGVWTLTREDQAATKLMANSDRWADDAVWSRDLIDLAMLADAGRIDPAGVAKAVRAYGDSVLSDLKKARTQLLERDDRLATCMARLQMSISERELRARIQALKARGRG
ncbi:MAG: nucleotidyl transferase AbiEii/AbiGii toxin family protein [Rubrivivax sp.]